jgi:hypothetical protein
VFSVLKVVLLCLVETKSEGGDVAGIAWLSEAEADSTSLQSILLAGISSCKKDARVDEDSSLQVVLDELHDTCHQACLSHFHCLPDACAFLDVRIVSPTQRK